MTRVTSMDTGYRIGDLSVFPHAVDTKDTLYEVSNNAATILKQGLPYNGMYIVVEDASGFPSSGLLRVGPLNATIPAIHTPQSLLNSGLPGTPGDAELIYYGSRTNNTFRDLIRGYAASRQNQWDAKTPITNSVVAETHNALKDALFNMETYLGTKTSPVVGSLTDRLKNMEARAFTPNPLFRAYPRSGRMPLTVNFQSLCNNNVEKYLWDFGDGVSVSEENPVHEYRNEGYYSVSLNIITNTNAQGIITKANYILVSNISSVYFYYTIDENDPTLYHFVDQTDGNIIERMWVYGDGSSDVKSDPDDHTADHHYAPGTYSPNLLVTMGDNSAIRGYLSTTFTVGP